MLTESRKKYMEEYRQTHKEQLREWSRKYRERNKERIKKYYEANKEKRRRYLELNRKRTNLRHKEYCQRNKEKIKAWEKEYGKKYRKSRLPWERTMKRIQTRCSPKGLYFKKWKIKNRISKEELKILWFRDKAYLMKKPSIDRIDGLRDYTFDNCRYIEMRENCARPKHHKCVRRKSLVNV